MKKVFVIDPTARQYVFDIKEEGLSVDVDGHAHIIKGDEDDIKKGEELGASEYLVKANFTLDELVEKVQELLG